nr:MAG TPA: hypothetical protein [Caudoviricetes sp.]
MSPFGVSSIFRFTHIGRRAVRRLPKVSWTYSPCGYCISHPLGIDEIGFMRVKS